MTVSVLNGYTTLQDLKDCFATESFDVVDDNVMNDLINTASRLIDTVCSRTFYTRTETRYFDIPGNRSFPMDAYDNRKGGGYRLELPFDDDLQTVTTLTNGDGTTIASTQYDLLPYNFTPKYALRLKRSSPVAWLTDTNGNFERVIAVAGTWGFCDRTTPADATAYRAVQNTRQACHIIAAAEYRRRRGQDVQAATITPAGVVLTPQGIPRSAWDLIAPFQRRMSYQ